MSGELIVIQNAAAGADEGATSAEELQKAFRSAGADARILLAESGADIAKHAKSAVANRPRAIVAGGGDGTQNAVATAVVGTDIPFGVLPLGTLNHFAKDLDIPLDIEGAVRTIVAGHLTEVDVGEVNGRIFLNNSGLGLYPSVVREREEQQTLGRGKWPAFAWALLSVLRRFPFLNLRLQVDGHEMVRQTPFVFIGNNEYEMELFNVGSRRCLDAGNLSVYMPHRTGRLGLVRLALKALLGRLSQAKDFDALCIKEMRIETKRRRVHVSVDGEVALLDTPLDYRIRPRALRVIVPAAGTFESA